MRIIFLKACYNILMCKKNVIACLVAAYSNSFITYIENI